MSRMKLEYTIDDIREVEQDAYERGRREALEEKPCENCISRDLALYGISWLPKHKSIGEGEWSIKESDIKGMLRGMVSVVPQAPKWIPVTKELPTLNDDGVSDMVLLCWSDGQRTVGAYRGDRTFVGQAWPEAKDVRVTVIAWMPLPEPYRAKEEDEQRGRFEKFNSVELYEMLDDFCEQVGCPLPVKTKNEIVANIALEQAKTVAADRLSQAMKESEERNG